MANGGPGVSLIESRTWGIQPNANEMLTGLAPRLFYRPHPKTPSAIATPALSVTGVLADIAVAVKGA
ncbi:MAG: hypothetical protein ACRD4E_10190 [Bryobacteraceae bacterium]